MSTQTERHILTTASTETERDSIPRMVCVGGGCEVTGWRRAACGGRVESSSTAGPYSIHTQHDTVGELTERSTQHDTVGELIERPTQHDTVGELTERPTQHDTVGELIERPSWRLSSNFCVIPN